MANMVSRIFFAVLFWCNVAWCMPYGQDTLGAARYPGVEVSSTQGAGHFSSTFGDIIPVLRREIKNHVPFIRLHLMWKDAHNFSRSDFPAIVKEARRICPELKAAPQVKWYLSGACEHRLNEKLARELAHLVQQACPEGEYVNTPMSGGAVLREYINEVHGGGKPKSPRYAFSFDGTAAEDSNVEAVKRNFPNSEYFFIWGPRYNGRWESNDKTPRPQRKGWPDAKYMRSLEYLTTPKGATKLQPNYTWKSHSENKGNGDYRAERPVAIIPPKVSIVTLKRDNAVIATMERHPDKFSDGRWRYYFPRNNNRFGYEVGMVDLFVAGKKVGTVNAGFRDGSYR